ncbi:hypothetical protein BKA82DRAFT_31710 [Pisolithus tinctorius]|uniref:Uncharacterized protein n=1 Tax=Pisolithus tinctorius Marx 270 TaxID=870435 RepID=A0A0C3NRV8_PISTI|nr:hypothetical protein BKA82DRAFT_31710 [Pisolithus tinctorius]KIN98023.1 hypothetical protein M404DRAFT_31710 [Pisolithus tinctorius Marx 270]
MIFAGKSSDANRCCSNYLSFASTCLLNCSGTTVLRTTMLNALVEDVVVLETLAEGLVKVGVVGLVIELKCLSIVEENAEFTQGAVVQQACGSTMLNALVEDMVALKTLVKEEVSKEPA